MAAIPATLARFADKIDEVLDERDQDNGWWIYLKTGWRCTHMETHCIHEDTLKQCADLLEDIEPCSGPCCRPINR